MVVERYGTVLRPLSRTLRCKRASRDNLECVGNVSLPQLGIMIEVIAYPKQRPVSALVQNHCGNRSLWFLIAEYPFYSLRDE